MTREQIKRFVKRHGGSDISVKFKGMGWYAARAYPERNTIYITTSHPIVYNWKIESLLLHELGHIKKNTISDIKYKNEYQAQKWAIEHALENLMYDVYIDLVKATRRWTKFGWNEDGGKWRIYRKAAKKLIKNGHAKLL